MSLFVDIEKKIGDFLLCSRFEAENETLAILGASGSGKSMTLKCIAGVETPDRGRIVLDGSVLFDSTKKINVPARLRKAGYLFQNYALFPNMTVAQNIACGIPKGQKD
jgi:molybdate transport system ATP-binding protein